MIKDFKVKIMRYTEAGGSRVYDGEFISPVYAIKENEFLVYDDMNELFMWVDFTQMYPIKDVRPVNECPPQFMDELAAVVTLWEGEV